MSKFPAALLAALLSGLLAASMLLLTSTARAQSDTPEVENSCALIDAYVRMSVEKTKISPFVPYCNKSHDRCRATRQMLLDVGWPADGLDCPNDSSPANTYADLDHHESDQACTTLMYIEKTLSPAFSDGASPLTPQERQNYEAKIPVLTKLCGKNPTFEICQGVLFIVKTGGRPNPGLVCKMSAEEEAAAAKPPDAEQQFLAAFEKAHPNLDARRRAAIALGYRADNLDAALVDGFKDGEIAHTLSIAHTFSDEAKVKLEAFQRAAGLPATGLLDEPTFLKLLDAPVDPDNFSRDQPSNVTAPVAFSDWYFGGNADSCTIWTNAVSISGRYMPIGDSLPRVEITRLLKAMNVPRAPIQTPNSLSMNYAEAWLYANPTDIYLTAGDQTFQIEYGTPSGTCVRARGNKAVCYGGKDVMLGLKNNSTITVTGPSAFGGDLAITYSTAGFLAAFRMLDSRCGHGNLASWLE